MIKHVFIIFLLIHVIGDFYLQTEKTAQRKQKQYRWTFYHIVVYALSSIFIFIIFFPGIQMKYIVWFIVSHGVIDSMKYVCQSKWFDIKNKKRIFIIDQLMHIAVMLGITFFLKEVELESIYRENILDAFESVQIHLWLVLSWSVKLLLIHKPVNILIAYILEAYRPETKQQGIRKDKNAEDL